MRIAYISNAYPPVISGAAVFAEQLATGMAARGHQVLVIAPSGNGHPYLEMDINLIVQRSASLKNPLRVQQWMMVYPRNFALKALGEFLPEIIHNHDLLQMNLVGVEFAKEKRIPIVMTTHQLPWYITSSLSLPPSLNERLETCLWGYASWILKKHDGIIAPSH